MSFGVVQSKFALLISNAIDFHIVFEHAPNAYMLLDRQFCYAAANQAYLRVTGRTWEELAGRNLFDAFPHDPHNPENDNARQLRESLERVLRTGQSDVIALIPYRIEKREADGTRVFAERYWSPTHTPILDARVADEFILQHTVDVTELQELEDAVTQTFASSAGTPLRQVGAGVLARAQQVQAALTAQKRADAAEATQRFLAEAIPQQVWTARPNGELEFVNRRVVDFFGVPVERILGDAWLALVHPDDRDGCVARWQRSLETGEEYEYEFRLKRRDGTYRWHLARALAQLDDDGAVLTWFGTNTDMDELKRARDELHDRADFEQRLIGIVSHDLRNPLDAIGVGAALLQKRGGLEPRQQSVVERLVKSSTRASRLVRDFLDFTQVRTAGRLPVNRVDCNLRDLARQAYDEVHVMQPQRRGQVVHEGEETGFWDPDRLSQAIGNLVANAFQHSPASEAVTVTTRGGGDFAEIAVHNGGPAIPPATLNELFEPFRRGDSRPSTGSSVGLGLYITRQIVLAHGGSIDVRSTTEGGTTFGIRLPRSERGSTITR